MHLLLSKFFIRDWQFRLTSPSRQLFDASIILQYNDYQCIVKALSKLKFVGRVDLLRL